MTRRTVIGAGFQTPSCSYETVIAARLMSSARRGLETRADRSVGNGIPTEDRGNEFAF